MLIQFNVKNFLSYRDKQVFSLLASSDKELDGNLINHTDKAFKPLVKAALLYGANASGKSNLIKALAFLQNFIGRGNSIQKDQATGRIPFKLELLYDQEPSEFELIFIESGQKYAYGLALTDTKVTAEYLYAWPAGRKTIIFERQGQKWKFTKNVEEQKALSKRTMENAPYLSVATNWNFTLTTPAWLWITQTLVLSLSDPFSNPIGFNMHWQNYTANIAEKNKTLFIEMLRQADFNIQSLAVKRRPASDMEIPPFFPPEMREQMKKNPSVQDIILYHYGKDKNGQQIDVPFHLSEESLGTQRYFEFLGPWQDLLARNLVLFLDEFDTGLHPVLAEYLLSNFLRTSQNAQFVFTTHNSNFLSSGLLRRDQFWITEINPDTSATELYSLIEVNIRKDHNMEKGYLAGKYGGVPFPGSLCG